MKSTGLHVAFDIGGTFTDVVIRGPGNALFTFKILTLPQSIGADVSECIQTARDETGLETARIAHGTTVASNAVLENKRAKTGLITTAGFRDDLEIRRQARPSVYDVFWQRTPPLIPRRLRTEVAERLRADGTVDTPLDEDELAAAIAHLEAQQVEAVAVSFLHAFVDPTHEERAKTLVEKRLSGVSVCSSSEVLGEMREYERTSTTALNASLMPVVGAYLDQLQEQLASHAREIYIMQSNGGVMSASEARHRPVQMIESGPAAGVLAAAALARDIGLDQAVAFDMGGTTAKACLIENGQPVETSEGEVGAGINIASRLSSGAGYAVRVPAYDIAEVGAGGGSVAWIDDGLVLRVGPHSAGAQPGPAAYGRGGVEPTITDANIALGYMNPTAIAGGRVAINADAAVNAIQTRVADPLQLDGATAAHGIHRVANATMSRAIRAVTTERGRDPREFTLIAFGGAGAIHAAQMALDLGIRTLVVPPHPGLFSALGLLMARIRRDAVRSMRGELLTDATNDEIFDAFDQLEKELTHDLPADLADLRFSRALDLRYARQSSELTVALPETASPDDFAAEMTARFHNEHERTYGYQRTDDPVVLAGVRTKATAAGAGLTFSDLTRGFLDVGDQAPSATVRMAYFGPNHGQCAARIVTRAELAADAMTGPLIVEEFDTTVVVPPNCLASVDALGNIVVQLNH
ncbi:MAG: hydantoinase/oxoprolinase family protein [Gammaproteobacteria bacterium]|nr:hydantoinase/oxoprolinase family protein [Gammaproteobacteria bacterium]